MYIDCSVRYSLYYIYGPFIRHTFAIYNTILFMTLAKGRAFDTFFFREKRKEYYILCFAEIFAISYVYRLLIVAKHKRRTRFSRPRKIVSSSFPLRIVDHYDGKMRVLLFFFLYYFEIYKFIKSHLRHCKITKVIG